MFTQQNHWLRAAGFNMLHPQYAVLNIANEIENEKIEAAPISHHAVTLLYGTDGRDENT